jgi:ubiquinone/menaquinone biosynthesis C-methylase UbiE
MSINEQKKARTAILLSTWKQTFILQQKEKKPMFAQLFDTACLVSPKIRRFLIRNWFQSLSGLDKEALMTFMNLGYASLDPDAEQLLLSDLDAINRYCIEMYHHVVSDIDLKGLDVLEVGSGRGGGASYVRRYLKPKSLTGLDISEKAVTFCNHYHHMENLHFLHGDAENLPFDDHTFDVIINIESSYGYGHIERFLNEVFRVLRPGGHFLFADYRNRENINTLRKQLLSTGFHVLKEERITANVLKALDLDQKRKLRLIEQKVPLLLRNVFYYFAAMQGSEMYQALSTGKVDYRSFTLSKNV